MIKEDGMDAKVTKDSIQNKALPIALSNKKAGLAISMGVGKTFLGLKYLSSLQYLSKSKKLKILIVAPKKTIIQNWKDEAEKFKMHSILENVTFSTYLSLTKQKYDYDVIVLDECHNLLFTHDNYLKNVSSRILGLTGTPPRHDNSEKGIMVNKYCPIRFEYLTDDAVGDNILNDYKIYVHYLSLRTNKELSITHKNGSFMTSELLNYMYWTNRVDDARPGKSKQIASVMRMKAMMEYPSKEDYAKQLLNQQTDKCILFCNTQAQSDKLCDYSYHSNNSDSEENLIKFKDGDINKLSCVLQLNEGVNIPNLKSGIIMHSYGNERKSSQRIGRLMRLNPKSTATIHILCYRNTVDEYWVQSALKDFDETKIIHLKDD